MFSRSATCADRRSSRVSQYFSVACLSHYSRVLLLQSPIPDSSETGETGGKTATRILKFRKLRTSNRRPSHTSRESRSSRLSRATPPLRDDPSWKMLARPVTRQQTPAENRRWSECVRLPRAGRPEFRSVLPSPCPRHHRLSASPWRVSLVLPDRCQRNP